jgi:hypothetical protein
MSNNSSSAGGGIGIAGALLILFVALKLTHVISWPWLWVLAPAWIPVGLLVGALIVATITAILSIVFGGDKRTGRH